eukprot:CAMPEP_0176023102 /NCGR_PEP_ID=MMETSP0120_2-20121206/11262_1 /TAXON_ID=160619 /ORGANISM="Kryptoperidinium foliaceum, Strain CCMP 1326" /LENGTH=275 /DNA_ID=CAMNT_0017356257 /DNA_START=464 /DNA_END=1286 /DNA_ORIENTATION=+
MKPASTMERWRQSSHKWLCCAKPSNTDNKSSIRFLPPTKPSNMGNMNAAAADDDLGRKVPLPATCQDKTAAVDAEAAAPSEDHEAGQDEVARHNNDDEQFVEGGEPWGRVPREHAGDTEADQQQTLEAAPRHVIVHHLAAGILPHPHCVVGDDVHELVHASLEDLRARHHARPVIRQRAPRQLPAQLCLDLVTTVGGRLACRLAFRHAEQTRGGLKLGNGCGIGLPGCPRLLAPPAAQHGEAVGLPRLPGGQALVRRGPGEDPATPDVALCKDAT